MWTLLSGSETWRSPTRPHLATLMPKLGDTVICIQTIGQVGEKQLILQVLMILLEGKEMGHLQLPMLAKGDWISTHKTSYSSNSQHPPQMPSGRASNWELGVFNATQKWPYIWRYLWYSPVHDPISCPCPYMFCSIFFPQAWQVKLTKQGSETYWIFNQRVLIKITVMYC